MSPEIQTLSDQTEAEASLKRPGLLSAALALGALGVVFGDIGTSVLYAFRECFNPAYGLPIDETSVLGILSLLFWALVLVVCVKYLAVVTRADNEGEGGIFALMARILEHETAAPAGSRRSRVIMLGLIGTALLVADGMLTPSISVLSAIEGLNVAAPKLEQYVIPITIGILAALFSVQKYGTSAIGGWFGPVMLVWFVSIAALGALWIVERPAVLLAINPLWAAKFFLSHNITSLMVLGAVVLAVTGCEALYADLGHFGRRPIAACWYWMVFPSLVLNYFGQGAFVLQHGQTTIGNPFFEMAPQFLAYPLVVLSAAATIIASQALISGMFSLARQAVQLDYLPRIKIVYTSPTMTGQIYVPAANTLLAVSTIALVLGFRTSSGMAAAYGIAVIGAMATTSLLMFTVEREQWGWKLWQALATTCFFIAVEAAFLIGNTAKILHGGWFPLAAGLGVLAVLTSWRRGSQAITRIALDRALPIEEFVASIAKDPPSRVRGTAVFITDYPFVTPRVLLHHLKHNMVLHEHIILLAGVTRNVPSIPSSRRLEITDLGNGFVHVVVNSGFIQSVNMKEIEELMMAANMQYVAHASYFIGHISLRLSGKSGLPLWSKAIFAFLLRNQRSAYDFYGIPVNRVVEFGEQTEL